MSYAGGIIHAPVSIDDVVAVLGENTYNLDELCHSAKINKWAKYKPTKGFSYVPLTEAQFRGTTTAQNNGIIYGLRVTNFNSFNVQALDECDYSYARVFENLKLSNDLTLKGSDDWARLTDFDGYDHNAGPEVTATVPEWFYYDTSTAIHVGFHYNVMPDGTGFPDSYVSLSEIIEGYGGGVDVGLRLPKMYPCALVAMNGRKAVRALSTSALEQTPQKLYGQYEDTQRTSWHMRLDGLESVLGEFVRDGEMRVTIFLSEKIVHSTGWNIGTNWQLVNKNMALTQFLGFTVPEAVNIPVITKRKYRPGLQITMPPMVFGRQIQIPVHSAESWNAGTYRIDVSVDSSDGNRWTGGAQHTFLSDGESDIPTKLETITINAGIVDLGSATLSMSWEVRFNGILVNQG